MTVIQRFVAWEQRKLNELTDYTDYRGKSPKKAVEGVQLITASNIRYGYIDYNADKQFVSEEDYPDIMRRGMPKIGEVLFTTEAPLGNVAQVNNENIALAQRVIKFDGKENLINNDYLFEYFLAPTFQVEINKKATGGTVKGIKGKVLHKIFINFPKTIEEQLKIGKLLKLLDETIALHQEKLDRLDELKKGYMQNVLPQKEQDLPKVRFTHYHGKWEQCKLGKIANIKMGQSPNGNSYTNNPNDHILVQGNADLKNGEVVPRVWTTQVTKTANPKDIILSVRAPVGDVAKTNYSVVLGRGVAGIDGNEFIYQNLLNLKVNGYWKRYSTGSTFESINSNDLKDASIFVPSKKEQYMIGDLLEKLDKNIFLQQTKINKLVDLKKSFLQRMFI